tara:strand:- start:58 stop:1065 length:1008 start_codon:yes stop_codon:yes gene_type:complete
MLKKIIIHIGPHKTGSSYLQEFLHSNKNILKENGYYYPDLSDDLGYGHHVICDEGYIDNEYENLIKNSPCDNILLSSENFSKLPSSEINKLKLDGYEYQIITYLRKPSERIRSYWAELIKHNELNSFEEFCFKHFLKPYHSDILNPFTLFDEWNAIFSRVDIIDYEKYKRNSLLEITNDFLEKAGIIKKLKTEKKFNERVNIGYGTLESEILRNYKLKIKSMDPNVNLYDLNVWKVIKHSKENGFYDLVESTMTSATVKDNIITRPYKEFLEEYLYDEAPLKYLEFNFMYFEDSSSNVFPNLKLKKSDINNIMVTKSDLKNSKIKKTLSEFFLTN